MASSSDRFPPPPRPDDSTSHPAAGKGSAKVERAEGGVSSPGSNCFLEPETVALSREVGLGGSGRSG